jgi:glycosyltransferase involved in cell wall biosynthesis
MKGNNRTILFLTTGLDYGGAETQLVKLAKEMEVRGWKVFVVSMLPPIAFIEELEGRGIKVASLGMKRGSPNPMAIIRLIRFIKEWKPVILHSHQVHANLLARITRIFCSFPLLICTAHNINEGGRVRELGYRFTDYFCDLTTIISQAAAERYVKIKAVPKSKIKVIPNGVDVEQFTPTSNAKIKEDTSNSFTWLAVGRFEVQKDYPNLIQAFSILLKKSPESKLLIVGQGPFKSEIEVLISESRIGDSIQLLGVRKDVPEIMNKVDGYVMSSAWEGLPMVLLEATSCGLPVVATDVGGNKEVVINEQTGLLVEPRDPASLSNAMLRLMSMTKTKRDSFGEKGRLHIKENYSLEKVSNTWEKTYNQLLFEKGIR